MKAFIIQLFKNIGFLLMVLTVMIILIGGIIWAEPYVREYSDLIIGLFIMAGFVFVFLRVTYLQSKNRL